MLLADPDGEPLTLRRCHLAVIDREVEALVRDWVLVREMGTWLSRSRAEMLSSARRTLKAGVRGMPNPKCRAGAG